MAEVHLCSRPFKCVWDESCGSFKRKQHLADHVASKHMKIPRETQRLSKKLEKALLSENNPEEEETDN